MMAELTISPDEIRDALQDFVKSYEPSKTATARAAIPAISRFSRRAESRRDALAFRRTRAIVPDVIAARGRTLFSLGAPPPNPNVL